jgi:alpha-amylase
VHRPYCLKQYAFSDIGRWHNYFDAEANAAAINTLADQYYLPANKIVLSQIKETAGKFKIAFSISGTMLELLQQYRSDVISSFRELVHTGSVEIIGETYYNSLSWAHSKNEFTRQVNMHHVLVKELLDAEPLVFRNTQLLYDNELAGHIASLGYKGIMCEEDPGILSGQSSNYTYTANDNRGFGILFYKTGWYNSEANKSQDIVTAQNFSENIFQSYPQGNYNTNLFFNYEASACSGADNSGTFRFLEELPSAILSRRGYHFKTPAEVLDNYYPKDIHDIPFATGRKKNVNSKIEWSDNTRELNMLKKLYKLEDLILENEDEKMLNLWGKLQSADYFFQAAEEQYAKETSFQLQNSISGFASENSLMANILTDFEISLIKNNIEKNRPRFNHQRGGVLF